MRRWITEHLRAARGQVGVLAEAFRHPRTPWYAKLWLLGVVAYAVSPIDLIPDVIPVLGLLDDAILIPLGVAVALRMVPDEVLVECRAAAATTKAGSRMRVAGVALVVTAWLLALSAVTLLVRRVA